MAETSSAKTRRLVALFVGGTVVVSLALALGAQVFSPASPHAAHTTSESANPVVSITSAPVRPPSAPQPSYATSSVVTAAMPSELPDEGAIMSELRAIKDRDPKRALELARQGNRRFPNTPEAAERASIAIHALSDLGLGSEARGEAEDMVNRYPDGKWVHEVEQFTGAHRHRNVRLNAEGKIEFYDAPRNAD